jgi:hypothetical protein
MWLSLWNQTASAHSLIQGSSFHDAFNQRSLSHGVVKNYKLQQLQESFSTKKSKLLAVYTRKKQERKYKCRLADHTNHCEDRTDLQRYTNLRKPEMVLLSEHMTRAPSHRESVRERR